MPPTRLAIIANRIGMIETYSIPLLSAMAKRRGHEVTLIEYHRDPKRAVQEIRDFEPDLLAYSVMSPDANDYIEINKHLKKETSAYSILAVSTRHFFKIIFTRMTLMRFALGKEIFL